MNEFKWIDRYLHTHYMGYIEGNYDQGCHLYFKDINNFVQNVGRFSNVEIIRLEDGDTLLNTCGTFIDRIWPRMSWSDRSSTETRDSINYIASKIGELREKEGLYPEPLPRIKQFMKETLGQEAVEANEEILKGAREEEQIESAAMEMQSL